MKLARRHLAALALLPLLPRAAGSKGHRMNDRIEPHRQPGIHQATFRAGAPEALRYTVSVPPPGAASPPLVLALHYGFDPNAPFPPFYGRGFLEGLVAPALAELGALVIAPDSHGARWTHRGMAERVLALVESIESAHGSDPARSLVVGYSMGGIGTWHLLGRAPPGRFRAAISISARPEPGAIDAFPAVPFLVIHGEADELFPIGEVAAAVESLRARSVPVEYRTVAGPTHFDVAGFTAALRGAVPWIRAAWAAAG